MNFHSYKAIKAGKSQILVHILDITLHLDVSDHFHLHKHNLENIYHLKIIFYYNLLSCFVIGLYTSLG